MDSAIVVSPSSFSFPSAATKPSARPEADKPKPTVVTFPAKTKEKAYDKRLCGGVSPLHAAASMNAGMSGEETVKEAKLWGGRFEESVTENVEKFTESISFDKELYGQDIRGSKAHASMLAKQGLMTISERDSVLEGLSEIERQIERGQFRWRADREDVHMNIEAALIDMIGEPAKKLHTARSRNDQVQTDFRLWCRDAIDRMIPSVKRLQVALVTLALKSSGIIVPGYTHLQRAQPVLLQHYLLSFVEQVKVGEAHPFSACFWVIFYCLFQEVSLFVDA